MPLRDRPKYLPGYSYDQSGGPKSITRQNFEMSKGVPYHGSTPPCPRCHKVVPVEIGTSKCYCKECDISFERY